MKFSEVYKLYKEPISRGDHNAGSRVPKLICPISGLNILQNLAEAEEYARATNKLKQFTEGDLYFYLKFMDSTGDVSLNNGLVSFKTYKEMYSRNWEIKWREHYVNTLKTNTALCVDMNIPERYYGLHFGALDQHTEQTELVNVAKNFGEKRRFKGSMLLGSGCRIEKIVDGNKVKIAVRGIGKTAVTVCSMMEYYKKFGIHDQWSNVPRMNRSMLMIKEYELYMLVRSTYQSNTPFYENDIIDSLCRVDYLFYDDLFAVADNDFLKRIVYTLIDRRVDCKDKTTAITTAYAEVALENNFPDIADRLHRGIWYYDKNIKQSYRRKQK